MYTEMDFKETGWSGNLSSGILRWRVFNSDLYRLVWESSLQVYYGGLY